MTVSVVHVGSICSKLQQWLNFLHRLSRIGKDHKIWQPGFIWSKDCWSSADCRGGSAFSLWTVHHQTGKDNVSDPSHILYCEFQPLDLGFPGVGWEDTLEKKTAFKVCFFLNIQCAIFIYMYIHVHSIKYAHNKYIDVDTDVNLVLMFDGVKYSWTNTKQNLKISSHKKIMIILLLIVISNPSSHYNYWQL